MLKDTNKENNPVRIYIVRFYEVVGSTVMARKKEFVRLVPALTFANKMCARDGWENVKLAEYETSNPTKETSIPLTPANGEPARSEAL